MTGICGLVGSVLAESLRERVEDVQIAGADDLMRPGAETNRVPMGQFGVAFIHRDLRTSSDIAGLPACDWVSDATDSPSVLAGLSGAGQFGTPAQGLFADWVNAHLRRRPLQYIGFRGSDCQTRDAFHPRDLAALLVAQMRKARCDQQRIYTAGGGPANTMSLAQLTSWCDTRFGPHASAADPQPRQCDIPWVATDNAEAARDFEWGIEMRLPTILEGIAQHVESHPDWLEMSQV